MVTAAGSPREVTLPRLPRIRTCPIRASGSSGQSFAARRSCSATHPLVQDFSLASCAIRRSFVEIVSEIGILVLLSLRRSSLPGAPLPSSGSLGVVPRSLRYYWGAPTSHRPRSPRLACTSGSVCSPCSLSLGTASAPASLGFGQRLSSRIISTEAVGAPRSLGNPCQRALLSDPGGPTTSSLRNLSITLRQQTGGVY